MAARQLLPVLLLLCALLDVSRADFYIRRSFDPAHLDKYISGHVSTELEKLTILTKELETLSIACEGKLNNTYDECSACTKTACSSSPTNMNKPNVLNSALATISNPSRLIGPALQSVGTLASTLTTEGSKILKTALGSVLKYLSDDAKKGLSNVFTNIRNTFENIGKSSGVQDIAKEALKGTVSVGKKIASGVETAANKVADGVKAAANKLAEGAKAAWDATTKFFGLRRRRSVTAQEQACYDKCPICAGIILPKTNDKINAVCGNDLISKNSSVVSTAQFIYYLSKAMEEYPGSYIKLEFPFSKVKGGLVTQFNMTGKLDKDTFTYVSHLEIPIQTTTVEPKPLIGNVLDEFLVHFKSNLANKVSQTA